jgi:hypothetical protein
MTCDLKQFISTSYFKTPMLQIRERLMLALALVKKEYELSKLQASIAKVSLVAFVKIRLQCSLPAAIVGRETMLSSITI